VRKMLGMKLDCEHLPLYPELSNKRSDDRCTSCGATRFKHYIDETKKSASTNDSRPHSVNAELMRVYSDQAQTWNCQTTSSSTKMLTRTFVATLALASGVLAAQLTQVSNYGGSARAKPGMWVIRAPPFQGCD